INTPYNDPYGSAAPGGTTTNYGQVQYQDVPTSNSNFDIVDISSGGNRESPPTTSYGANKQSVTVDYAKYVNTYPYDHNQAQADYTTNYRETTWSATTFNHWQCNNGGSWGTGGANGCGTYTVSDNPGCEYPATYNGVPFCAGYYPCPSGYSGTSPSCYLVENYPGPTAYYSWANYGTANKSQRNSTNGYAMNQCFLRQFTVKWQPSAPTTGSLQPTAEDPTSASFNGQVSVHFYGVADSKGLRQPSKVVLNYGGSIASPNLPGYGSCSGSNLTVTSANTSPDDERSSGFSVSCPVKSPPLEAGQQVCINMTVSPQQGNVDDAGNMSSTSGTLTATPLPCTNKLTNEPYAHFFINGVAAGGAFETSSGQCGASGAGNIAANIDPSGYPLRGSGAQFGSIAEGNVSEFGSASLRTSQPTTLNGLTFANNGALGHLGTNPCLPDYYGDASLAQSGSANGRTITGGGYTTTVIKDPGNTTLGNL
ncbi:MAG: hypothetical protein ACREHG_03365, partial [Candidatus Saccharimonadales bacterium]